MSNVKNDHNSVNNDSDTNSMNGDPQDLLFSSKAAKAAGSLRATTFYGLVNS